MALLLKEKGIENVLKSISVLRSKYPKLLYYIIGDGKDADYFRSVSKKLQVDDITFFLGQKTNDEVLAYMKICDIFVLPSRNESFGIVFIEAMAMKSITVGSFKEGIEDIIKDGYNGFLVDSRDVNSLIEKLDYILSHMNKMDQVRKNAYQSVKHKFTWENNAKKYISIFDKVVFQKKSISV